MDLIGSKSLREVCVDLKVSRRAVQEYERLGLTEPTGKTSRGYLLYDDGAQDKIREIKKYQDYGFMLKDIKQLFAMPAAERKAELEKRYKELLAEEERMKNIISVLLEEIKQLEEE